MEFHRIMQYWVELQIIAWIYIELNRNTKNITKYAENAKQLKGQNIKFTNEINMVF